jgi:hypothetical protein
VLLKPCSVVETQLTINLSMRQFVFLSIIFMFCVSCKEKRQQIHNNATYTISLDNVKMEETPLKASMIFKNVRTIILEDHDHAIIGKINRIQVFENYIFVLDEMKAKKLFVFDKNGKYIRHIGNLGHGPCEYVALNDFCIIKEKREICLLDNLRKILIYDIDSGKHKKTVNYRLDELRSAYIAYNNNKFYMATVPYENDENSNLLMELDMETGEQKQFLNADTYNCGWNRNHFTPYSFFSAQLSDSPKFIPTFANTIMSIEKDTVRPYLTVYHKDWARNTDILSEKKLEELGTDQFSYLFSKNRTWLLQHNYTESDKYIYFDHVKGSVLFDKQTQKTTLYRHGLYNDLHGIGYTNLMFYNSQFAYEYFFEGQMFDIVEAIHSNRVILNQNLDKRDELSKLDGERFVIFEYEFK